MITAQAQAKGLLASQVLLGPSGPIENSALVFPKLNTASWNIAG